MREFEVGMMAKSLSGHDKDSLYIIMDIKDDFVFLVDGRIKTLEKPKKKRKKHIQIIYEKPQIIVNKLENNEIIQNEDIKRSIKLYKLGGNANV